MLDRMMNSEAFPAVMLGLAFLVASVLVGYVTIRIVFPAAF